MAIIVCRIVEVCVFRFVKDRPWYLMLKRAPDERIYPGLWQFVSGSIVEGEKAFDAALRELKEETGLTPNRFWAVPHVSTFYDPAYDALNLSPLFAAQVGPRDEPRLSAEHSSYEWVSFEEAMRRLVWPGQRDGIAITEKFILGGEEAGLRTLIPL